MNLKEIEDAFLNKDLFFKREVSAFLTDEHGLISLSTGVIEDEGVEPTRTEGCGGAVDFNWGKIWGYLKESDIKASKATMVHTHPHGHDVMSSTDLNMVQGWRLGLGIPIDFDIVTQHIDEKRLTTVTRYGVDRGVDKKVSINRHDVTDINECYASCLTFYRIMYGLSKMNELTQNDILLVESKMKLLNKVIF